MRKRTEKKVEKTKRTPAKTAPKRAVNKRAKKKEALLTSANFSRNGKYMYSNNRIINLSQLITFQIVVLQAPKPKEGQEAIVIENPYRVFAVMALQECPCWDFATGEEAEEFIKLVWKLLK